MGLPATNREIRKALALLSYLTDVPFASPYFLIMFRCSPGKTRGLERAPLKDLTHAAQKGHYNF